ncbi:hypothetical protein AVEN_2127-1 [Araneus ventricosus]|uniref:Uncharacterized protein n=1 Tax=Araneus ventricosus TaxID=182803 RepID=A0A4Y2ED45_ARAVE|nr:hypothetical protein AVEN_2127-1 [Araneus ventricosus]
MEFHILRFLAQPTRSKAGHHERSVSSKYGAAGQNRLSVRKTDEKWSGAFKSLKLAIHLKDSHAICPKSGLFYTHFNRKIQGHHSLVFKKTLTLNEGRGKRLLLLSTAACQSLFDFPQSADFNL